jgi:hypothetical protein
MTEARKLADAICLAAVESLMEYEPYNPVHELCLCEHDKVIPRPDELYRFTVDQNCNKCLELERAYLDEKEF